MDSLILAGLPKEYYQIVSQRKALDLQARRLDNEEYRTRLAAWAQKNGLLQYLGQRIVDALFVNNEVKPPKLMQVHNVEIDGKPHTILVNPYTGRMVMKYPETGDSGGANRYADLYYKAIKQAEKDMQKALAGNDKVEFQQTLTGDTIIKVKDQEVLLDVAKQYIDFVARHWKNSDPAHSDFFETHPELPSFPIYLTNDRNETMKVDFELERAKDGTPIVRSKPKLLLKPFKDENGNPKFYINIYYDSFNRYLQRPLVENITPDGEVKVTEAGAKFLRFFSKEGSRKLSDDNRTLSFQEFKEILEESGKTFYNTFKSYDNTNLLQNVLRSNDFMKFIATGE